MPTPAPWAKPGHNAVRLDPEECGCTDCLTGYSIPLDEADADQLWAAMHGDMQDASQIDWNGARKAMRDALVAWARN